MSRPKLTYAIGNGASTNISGSITGADTELILTADTNFNAKSGEGMVIVDESSVAEELIYATGKTGATLAIPVANRGLEGGSAQAHASGATIKGIISAAMWNDMIDSLTNVVSKTTGNLDTTKVVDLTTAQTLTNKTLTTPKIASLYQDAGGTKLMTIPNTASDTLAAIAATQVLTNKTYVQKVTSYSPAGAGTTTITLDTGNVHVVTMPANTQTLAISGATVGQCFVVEINNVTSQGALTWFTTIRWANGVAGTLCGTNGKRDVFGFRVTGAGTYDGYIIGRSL
jgi:hypothetical protein